MKLTDYITGQKRPQKQKPMINTILNFIDRTLRSWWVIGPLLVIIFLSAALYNWVLDPLLIDVSICASFGAGAIISYWVFNTWVVPAVIWLYEKITK